MSSPVPIFGLQDLHDDDAAVIASFDIETDAPADVRDATEPIQVVKPQTPEQPNVPQAALPPTRLLAGTELLNGGAAPVQILPADTRRQDFRLDVVTTSSNPATNNDYVLVGDELGKMYGVMASGTFRVHSGKGVDLTYHTGPIWVVPGPGISATIEVAWRATTY